MPVPFGSSSTAPAAATGTDPGCVAGSLAEAGRGTARLSAPTLTPSVLCNPQVTDLTKRNGRCHSYVTNGRIRFLDDCWHELRGSDRLTFPPID